MEQQEAKAGSRLLIEALRKQEVEFLFGYPGGAVLPLYDEIYRSQFPHVLARHEQGAVHAAEGYAKASGKPGVVLVTSGPGATNVITGIADAMSDSVPLVVLTGQVARPGIGKDAFQEADILSLTMAITKNNYQVRAAADLPRVINEAFHVATTGRKGPVVIDLPKDVTLETYAGPTKETFSLPGYQPTLVANEAQVEKVYQALVKAKRPLVLAGAGCLSAQATAELQAFVARHQLPVVTTLLGLGTVPTASALFLGMGGMHGSYAANMAISECDLLLNFGSRFDDRLASVPAEFAAKAKIVHVDIDPAEIGKVVRADFPIVGDAKNVLAQLLAKPAKTGSHEAWLDQVISWKTQYPYTFDRQNQTEIKPQRVIECIGSVTKGAALVATDVGQHQMWVAQYYPFQFAQQIITSGGLGTMGYGIPAGIGAKLACPERDVVVVVGDGGFQMTNQELALLSSYQLDVKVVLLNNHSLGMVRQWQESFFGERHSESVFEQQPDFMKLAEAYHLRHVQIDYGPTWERDFQAALAKPGAVVIEVLISDTEHVTPMVPAGKNNHEMLGVMPLCVE